MISNVATDPHTGRQVIVANFESFRKKLEDNIDKSCNEFLAEPDWNKNFEIYDALNRTAYLCPFGVAAIRRKLKTKNPEIEILALHLLEGMIKNVPSSHGAVAQPSFMRYLVKVALDTRKDGMMKSIGKKFKKETSGNKAHLRAQTIDKALLIIQMLKTAYENSNTYPIFVDTYKQLSKQGVRFPVLTKDETDQVFAPMHSAKYEGYGKNLGKQAPSALGSVGQLGNSVVTNHANIDRTLPMIRRVKMVDDVFDNELKTAQENALFFFEMVNSSEPGSNLRDNDLIQQLHTSVSEWQARVVMKISDPNCNAKIMEHGFAINDMMNNLMTDYEGLLIGTKRRYEEGLGDIDEIAGKKKKGKKKKGDKDNEDNSDESDNEDENNKNSDKKEDDNDDEDEDGSKPDLNHRMSIPPPPQDEGNNSNHVRRQSRANKIPKVKDKTKDKVVKHNKQNSEDILDLFASDNNNNNNNNSNNSNNNSNINNNNNSEQKINDLKKQPPALTSDVSSLNIFDIMAGMPSSPPESQTTNNMNTIPENGNTDNGLNSLGDPFSGNKTNNGNIPQKPSNDFLGDSNPFDMLGGGGNGNGNNTNANTNGNINGNINKPQNNGNTNLNGNNNNNNNNSNLNGNSSKGSSNPFATMGDDPFASLGAPPAPSSATTTVSQQQQQQNKPNGDFMGGGSDNPFASFGGNGAPAAASAAANTNNNAPKQKKDDFLGGSNPFADFVD